MYCWECGMEKYLDMKILTIDFMSAYILNMVVQNRQLWDTY